MSTSPEIKILGFLRQFGSPDQINGLAVAMMGILIMGFSASIPNSLPATIAIWFGLVVSGVGAAKIIVKSF